MNAIPVLTPPLPRFSTSSAFVRVDEDDHPFSLHRLMLRQAFMAHEYQGPYVRYEREGETGIKTKQAQACMELLSPSAVLLTSPDRRPWRNRIYVWEGGYLQITRWKQHRDVHLEGLPWDPTVRAIRDYLDTIPRRARPAVKLRMVPRLSFLVSAGSMGLRILEREMAWGPLERGNYEPEALEGYDQLVRLFLEDEDTPGARLAVLSGPPGTGKTYLLRGLCHALMAKRRAPILLSPDVVAQIGRPEFLAWFLGLATEHDGPIRLLVEDADHLLLNRDQNPHGLSSLSNLLQVTSGMLGEALNVRICCTINEWDESRIDPAILRPGRLAFHATVRPLSPMRAAGVAKRLGKTLPHPRDPVPLANLYALE